MTDAPKTTETPNMDKALALLREAHGHQSPLIQRIEGVEQAGSELFDASSRILEWLRTIRTEDRPIALFNRLEHAINAMREAHQMEPRDCKAIVGLRSWPRCWIPMTERLALLRSSPDTCWHDSLRCAVRRLRCGSRVQNTRRWRWMLVMQDKTTTAPWKWDWREEALGWLATLPLAFVHFEWWTGLVAVFWVRASVDIACRVARRHAP